MTDKEFIQFITIALHLIESVDGFYQCIRVAAEIHRKKGTKEEICEAWKSMGYTYRDIPDINMQD